MRSRLGPVRAIPRTLASGTPSMPGEPPENIRHLPDVSPGGTADAGPMITITLESQDPPCGMASTERGDAVRFEGWLGMLRVLSDLVAASESLSPESVGFPDPGAARFRRELDPRGDSELSEHVG